MEAKNCLGQVSPMREAKYYGSFEHSVARAGISCRTTACPLVDKVFSQMVGLQLDERNVVGERARLALEKCRNRPQPSNRPS